MYEISFYAARDAQGAPVATILLESAAADKPPVDIEYPASPVLELSDVDIVMRQDKSPDYMPWARAVVDFFEGLKETGQIATTAVEDSLVLGSNYVKDKEEEGYTFLSKGGHSITIGYSKFSGPSADLKISIVNRGFGDKSQFIALPMASLREVRFDKAAQKIVLSVENGARASV